MVHGPKIFKHFLFLLKSFKTSSRTIRKCFFADFALATSGYFLERLQIFLAIFREKMAGFRKKEVATLRRTRGRLRDNQKLKVATL